MAYVFFDHSYAPGGFLIVADEASPYSEKPGDTHLVQTDWEYAPVASRMGWEPCQCGGTDGTVACKECGREVSPMLSEAYDWICERAEEPFPALDDFLSGPDDF